MAVNTNTAKATIKRMGLTADTTEEIEAINGKGVSTIDDFAPMD